MSGRAKFVHWMVLPFDDIPSEPMFNVIENDKGLRNGSTIGGGTLMTQYGINLPLFPDLATWKRETAAKRRCFRCWAVTRGPGDNNRHREIVHHEDRRQFLKEESDEFWREMILKEQIKDAKAKRNIGFIGLFVLLAGLLLSAVPSVHAWEFRENPDRFPSLGFQAHYQYVENLSVKPLEIDTAMIDARLPVDRSITVSLSFETMRTELFQSPNTRLFSEQPNLKGYTVGAGFRYYFNR